jgi:hypothetical protein
MSPEYPKSRSARQAISRWVGVLSLVLALVAFIRTCAQDSKLGYLQHRLNAVQYRPRLAAAGPFEFSRPEFMMDDFHRAGDTVLIDVSARLDGTLRVANDGNAPAVLIARMSGKGPGGSCWLRSILKRGNLQNVTEDQLMDYGRDYLAVGETLDVPVGYKLPIVTSDSEAVLHFLFLYENEMGELYDSYLWVRVRLPPAESVHVTEAMPSGVVVRYPSVRIENPTDASCLYDGSAAAAVRRSLRAAERMLPKKVKGDVH